MTKDNLALRKKLLKKETEGRPSTTRNKGHNAFVYKTEPFSDLLSPLDEITPIRHVIVSKRGEVISQDQLFD